MRGPPTTPAVVAAAPLRNVRRSIAPLMVVSSC